MDLTLLAMKNEKLAVVCPAMTKGCGLSGFAEYYPDRFFDCGIAEEHAVTFAAGLAKGGLTPVVCTYSTFMQRAYDEILHDVSMNDLHVVFCLDRAGLPGNDGKTHQGIYDLSYLGTHAAHDRAHRSRSIFYHQEQPQRPLLFSRHS